MTAAPLFFSEYAEGSSNNKYLEIYNNSRVDVSLDDYFIARAVNGANGSHESEIYFPDGAIIKAGSTYVVAHSSANDLIKSRADLTTGSLSHNGDDGTALAYGPESNPQYIDWVGDFGADPGSGWPVAGESTATKDHTLIRKDSVSQGAADWDSSRGTSAANSEWIVQDKDYFINNVDSNSLGSHNDFVFRVPDLFFSEFSSFGDNDYVEIFNPGGAPVDLGDYRIARFIDGSEATPLLFSSDTALADGAVALLTNDDAHADLLLRAALSTDLLALDGNDTLRLQKSDGSGGWTDLDVIGDQNATPPATGWDVAGTSEATAENTLIRNDDVTMGTTVWLDSSGTTTASSQWTVLERDAFLNGNEQARPGSYRSYVWQTPARPAATELFISEYAEGTGNNKYIEIYNPFSDEAQLSEYAYARVFNGSPDGNHEALDFFADDAAIPAGGTYVIAHPRADARILARADEQSTNISFNGDDAFALVRAVDGDTAEGSLIQEGEQTFQVIDSLGDFGANPGYGFDAAGVDGATLNRTLIRKPGFTSGHHLWAISSGEDSESSEWILLEQDAFLEYHPLASPGSHTIAASGPAPIANLFFSEYAEGSGNNKYLEIYNASDREVLLSDYLLVNTNGGGKPDADPAHYEYDTSFPESASILPGDVYVVAHSGAKQSILDHADFKTTLWHNGDDAYALIYGKHISNYEDRADEQTILDRIGDFGADPGSGWDVAGVINATKDHTLVRKASVDAGNPDWSDSRGSTSANSEWVVHDMDFDQTLGAHDYQDPYDLRVGADGLIIQDIVPAHDANVASSSPLRNFGTANNLFISSADAGDQYGNQRGWLQYNLNNRIPEHANLTAAKLRFYLFRAERDQDFDLSVHLGSDAWEEASISWQNQPLMGSELASISLAEDLSHQWYEVDVTGAVAKAMADDEKISFVLKASDEFDANVNPTAPEISVGLNAKEYSFSEGYSGNYAPKLRLEYDAAPVSDGGLQIIHFNDIHSRVQPHDFDFPSRDDQNPVLEQAGGAAQLTTKLLELKAAHPDALVLDAGDMSEGGPLGDLRGNGGTIDVLKAMDAELKKLPGNDVRGIDALVVGNHDARYLEYITNLADSGLPVLSLNITHDGTDDPYFDPYVIIETGGQTVGVLGYSTDDSTYLGPETDALLDVKDVVWSDTSSRTVDLKDWVQHLRYGGLFQGFNLDTDPNQEGFQGVDSVVLLSHIGQSRLNAGDDALLVDTGDVKLPEVVISGHWHTMTETAWQPSNLHYNTTVVEAASYMQYIGLLELDQDGRYVDAEKFPIKAGAMGLQENAAVKAVVDGLITEYESTTPSYDLEQVIGYSAVPLSLDKDKWFTVSEFPWSGDNTAGFWTTDSMLYKANEAHDEEVHIALQTGGGLRRSIAAGPITYREIRETYPWRDDNMVVVEMTGEEIWGFLEGMNAGAALSHGWEVTANDGIIQSIDYNGLPLDLNRTFNAVISEYMYNHEDWQYTGQESTINGSFNDKPLEYVVDPGTGDYVSIRQSMIDYTSQFDIDNPMQISGPRYNLDTEFAGGFKAVVTMLADSENHPYFEAAFVRLLEPTDETKARKDGYGLDLVLDEMGDINPAAQFSETMLYRSHLGFPIDSLEIGDVIEIWGEGGFHEGNPQFVEQNGIVGHGQEFAILDHDPALAEPEDHATIGSFWNDQHENHLVRFTGTKVGYNTIEDAEGRSIRLYKEGGYYNYPLPGDEGDTIELVGVNTYRHDASSYFHPRRRFRVRDAVLLADGDLQSVDGPLEFNNVEFSELNLGGAPDTVRFDLGRGNTIRAGVGPDRFVVTHQVTPQLNDRLVDFQLGRDELVLKKDNVEFVFGADVEMSQLLSNPDLAAIEFSFTPDLRTARGSLHAIAGQTSLLGAGLRLAQTDDPISQVDVRLTGGSILELTEDLPPGVAVNTSHGSHLSFSATGGANLSPQAVRQLLASLRFRGAFNGTVSITAIDSEGLQATSAERPFTLIRPQAVSSLRRGLIQLDRDNPFGGDIAFNGATESAIAVTATAADDSVQIMDAIDGFSQANGLAGNDVLSAPQGGLLNGGDDDDVLIGSAERFALLKSGSGDDVLVGGVHSSMDGGSGDDTLISMGGLNVLHGGEGADRFVLADTQINTSVGPNELSDFKPGEDLLVFAGNVADGVAPTFRSASSGKGVEVRLDGQHLATMTNLHSPGQITASSWLTTAESLSAPLIHSIGAVADLHSHLAETV